MEFITQFRNHLLLNKNNLTIKEGGLFARLRCNDQYFFYMAGDIKINKQVYFYLVMLYTNRKYPS